MEHLWNFISRLEESKHKYKTNRNVIFENKINCVNNDVISKTEHLQSAAGLNGQFILFSHHFYHSVITVNL